MIRDMQDEISRLRIQVADTPFNSEFTYHMHLVKIRAHEMDRRIQTLTNEIKSYASAQHATLHTLVEEYMRDISELYTALAALRTLRAERSQARYRQMQELKNNEIEEGGEK